MQICVQSLWIGSCLSLMEQLSIRSFLSNGHTFHLYVYEGVQNVPEGTVLKDAHEILPKNDIFACTNGSYTGFANIFRYKLLFEKGGYWSDLDVVCLKPFDFSSEFVIASEYKKDATWKACVGVLRVPRSCKFIMSCYEKSCFVDKSNVEFGQTGYLIFEPMLADFNLQRFVYPPELFCSLNWWDFEKLIDPNSVFEIPPGAYAIHLWNEMWRRKKLEKDILYSAKSLYGKLQRLFLS